jgi:hypothetical protein
MIKKLIKKVAKALAPVIIPVVAIVFPPVIPAIGAALGATGVAATAVGAAVLSGGTTALAGGSGEDILKAAAAGGLGAGAGQLASQAVQSAQAAGSLSGAIGGSSALPAAAGGAAASGTQNLVYTGDVKEALKAAGLGGAAAGAGQLASTGAQQALPSDVGRTTQGLVAGGVGGATEAAVLGEDPLTGALLSAGQTAAQTKIADAEAARIAREKQLIAAFEQPKSPGVGTQIGEPTAALGGTFIPEDPAQAKNLPAVDLPNIGVVGQLPTVEVTAPKPAPATAAETKADILETILAQSPTTPVPIATPSDITPPRTVTPDTISPVLSSTLTPPLAQPAPAPAPTIIPEKDRPIMDLAGITPPAATPAPEQVAPETAQPAPEIAQPAPVPPVTAQPPIVPEVPTAQAPAPAPETGMVAGETGTPINQLPEVSVTGSRPEIDFVSTLPTPPAPGTAVADLGVPTAIPERDRQILELTGLAPEPNRLPEVEVTAKRPEVDFVSTPRLPEVEVGAVPEEEAMASQTFPLTPPSEADRRLINYMYGNMGSPFGVPLGQMAPGSSALAQALSVGDPGALYLGKKGRERKPVWNVESLKLTDELGGTYG